MEQQGRIRATPARLATAIAIDETKALLRREPGAEANHWFEPQGRRLPQRAGMVTALMYNAAAHPEGDDRAHRQMEDRGRFVRAPLGGDRVWSGPAHAKHDHAGRMVKAFVRWQKTCSSKSRC